MTPSCQPRGSAPAAAPALPAVAQPRRDFSRDRAAIDRELLALLPPIRPDDIVGQAIHYAVFGGAQRLRPLLSLRVARVLGAESRAVLRAAAATEFVHCASLIVDDLPCMDDAATRRGRPSLHVRFGEANALLAAFAMVALAARCVLDPDLAAGSGARLAKFQRRLLGVLDPASLIHGQALDLQSAAPSRSTRITELKTVPLFELAVEAGGVSSPSYGPLKAPLLAFGRQFGLAYQMVDDYLDSDLHDFELAAAEVERARRLAPLPGHGHLLELVDYLHARLTKDRRHR
jgi:geranylgeranyl pyrophosphate synthase